MSINNHLKSRHTLRMCVSYKRKRQKKLIDDILFNLHLKHASQRSTKLLQKMSRLKIIDKLGSTRVVTDTRSSLRKKTWKLVGDNPKSNSDIHSDNPRSNDYNLRSNIDMMAINLDPTASTSAIQQ